MNKINKSIQVMQQNLSNKQEKVKLANDILEISDKTKDFVNKLSNSSTEIIKDFLNTNAKRISLRSKDSKLYQYDNLLLFISNGKNAVNLEQNLNLADKRIKPKFVSYFQLGSDEFLSVLEGDSSEIIPYNKILSTVTKDQKKNFKDGLKTFLENSQCVNKEIFANKEPLFFAKSSGKIIYGDWEQATPVDPTQKAYFKNLIDNLHI